MPIRRARSIAALWLRWSIRVKTAISSISSVSVAATGTIFVFHGPGQRFEAEGLELKPDGTSLARYQLTNVRGGQADNWRLNWRTVGGQLQTLAIDADDEQVLVADGWGQRASKDPYTTLPFVIRRRDADTDTLDSRFLSLYERLQRRAAGERRPGPCNSWVNGWTAPKQPSVWSSLQALIGIISFTECIL